MAPEAATKKPPFTSGLSDRQFLALSIALFALVVLALLGASSLFMDRACVTGDTGWYYRMAHVILAGGTPYLDYQDSKPPLIFFTLALPAWLGQEFYGGLLLVGLCDLASAVLVLLIARRFYGRAAGLAGGLLFLANMGWAQGFFVIIEPFTVLFLLLATYFAFVDRRCFAAGLCVGVAIGFKQYALLTVPLLALTLLMEKEARKVPVLLAGAALPMLGILGAIFAAYGRAALDAALFWIFGIAGSYVEKADVSGDMSGALYTGSAPYEPQISAAIALILAATLAAGLLRGKRYRRLNTVEIYLLLSAAAYAATLLIRPYLHYWALTVPFIAILWAGWLLSGWRSRALAWGRQEDVA